MTPTMIMYRCSGSVSAGSCWPQRTEDRYPGPRHQSSAGSTLSPMTNLWFQRASGSNGTTTVGSFRQAFVLGQNLAVQFHPEMSSAILGSWIVTGGAEEMGKLGLDIDELVRQTAERDGSNRDRAHRLVDLFLDHVAVQAEAGRG